MLIKTVFFLCVVRITKKKSVFLQLFNCKSSVFTRYYFLSDVYHSKIEIKFSLKSFSVFLSFFLRFKLILWSQVSRERFFFLLFILSCKIKFPFAAYIVGHISCFRVSLFISSCIFVCGFFESIIMFQTLLFLINLHSWSEWDKIVFNGELCGRKENNKEKSKWYLHERNAIMIINVYLIERSHRMNGFVWISWLSISTEKSKIEIRWKMKKKKSLRYGCSVIKCWFCNDN